MAQKISRARRKAMHITVTPKLGYWIKYQLNLNSITYRQISQEAGRSVQLICDFIKGRKNSEAVKAALCKVLGYASFDLLVAASRDRIAA